MSKCNAYYSRDGSRPERLPQRIRLPDGFTRTSLREQSEEQLAEWGFVRADNPPDYDPEIEKLGWERGAWVVMKKSKTELLEEKQRLKDEKLAIQEEANIRVADCDARIAEKQQLIDAVQVVRM